VRPGRVTGDPVEAVVADDEMGGGKRERGVEAVDEAGEKGDGTAAARSMRGSMAAAKEDE
jgi:hypothetical protein